MLRKYKTSNNDQFDTWSGEMMYANRLIGFGLGLEYPKDIVKNVYL